VTGVIEKDGILSLEHVLKVGDCPIHPREILIGTEDDVEASILERRGDIACIIYRIRKGIAFVSGVSDYKSRSATG